MVTNFDIEYQSIPDTVIFVKPAFVNTDVFIAADSACLFFPSLCYLMLTIQILSGGVPAEDMPQWVFFGFITLLSLAYCGYQFYGLYNLRQQYKKMLPHFSISYDDLL